MLREPIGKYPVGIRKYDTDIIGTGSLKRRIPLTLYYPSMPWDEEYPYMDAAYQRSLPEGKDNGVHTYCGMCPSAADSISDLPVILANHGLSGFEMESTVLCADLASNGYLVVSVGHPYGAAIVTYTDGSFFIDPEPFEEKRNRLDETEPIWYEDIYAAIARIEELNASDPEWLGKIKTDNMGTLGVSYGGCCGVAAALRNENLKYAINLDGSMFVEPEYIYKDKPIFVMCSPRNFWAYEPLIDNGCSRVKIEKIKKITHFEFSDGIYLGDKGKSNREWADRISRSRAETILDFLNSIHSVVQTGYE